MNLFGETKMFINQCLKTGNRQRILAKSNRRKEHHINDKTNKNSHTVDEDSIPALRFKFSDIFLSRIFSTLKHHRK